MKKLTLIALSLVLVLAMTACGSSNDAAETTTAATTAATETEAANIDETESLSSSVESDGSFDAAQAAPLIGSWDFTYEIPAETFGLEGFDSPLAVQMTYTLSEDATWTMALDAEKTQAELAEFTEAICSYTIDLMYKQFAEQNMDKEQANEAMQKQYGMTIEEYVNDSVSKSITPEMLSVNAPEQSGSYYVDGTTLHMQNGLYVENVTFSLDGDTLTLQSSDSSDQTMYPLVMTRNAQ